MFQYSLTETISNML